jgi:lipase chaperone LimK
MTGKITFLAMSIVIFTACWWYAIAPADGVSQPMVATTEQHQQKVPSRRTHSVSKSTINAAVQQPMFDEIPAEVFERLPGSLTGLPLPEALMTDEQGNLVVNQLIRNLFDFYLTAIGEESLELIIARIKHQLTAQLTGPALAQSMAILTGYLQYRNNLAKILNEQPANLVDTSSLDTLGQHKQLIADSRYQFLDALVIEAFFAEQDQYDEYMLAQKGIMQNPQLTAELKAQAMDELTQQAPDWLRKQQKAANQLSHFHQQQQMLKAQQGSAAGIQRLRENTFGIEAADRLARLAEKRQQWQSKLAQYHQQLAMLPSNSNADDTIRQQQITQLQQQYFSGRELIRIAAITRSRGQRR